MDLEMALQLVIAEWLSQKKSRSLRALALKTDVSYPTIHRMSQASGPFRRGNILKVLQTVLEDADRVMGFCVEFLPSALPIAEANLTSHRNVVNIRRVSPLIVKIWREVCFKECDESFLIEKYGRIVKPSISALCESKVFVKTDGKVSLSTEEQYVNSDEFTRETIKQNADDLELGEPGHLGASRITGINHEGATAAYNLVEKFVIDLDKVVTDPKFKGDLKLSVSALMTLIETRQP